MTRFEFATALNACLDKVNQIINTDITGMVNKGDLATLQKLQEEFVTELATLWGRVDTLEARAEQLEGQQFSTTTKLVDSQLIFAATDAFGDASRSGNRDDSKLTFSTRLRLNFKASFTNPKVKFPKDKLNVRIQASNVINPITPGNDARLSFQSGNNSTNDVFVSKLEYSYEPSDQVKILIATGSNTYFDDWDVINPLKSDADGAISRYGRYSPIFRLGGDTGIGVTYKPSRNIKLEMAYLAKNTNNPVSGLFNSGYGALGQIIYYPMCKKDNKKTVVADTVLADKGYDANERVIERLQAQGKTPVIPPKRNRTRPRDYDRDLYKARHLIENFFAKLKQYRAIATRYDKRATNFLGAIYLAASVIWLN